MSERRESYEIEERIDDELRYTEALSEGRNGQSRRVCSLWKSGIDEPVSSLMLFPYQHRFGAAALPVEGYGGVETSPQFRGRGYARHLLARSLARLRTRVACGFLFGIEELYTKFGFATCLEERSLKVWVGRTEALGPGEPSALRTLPRSGLPLLVDLYNRAHRERPWTMVRDRERWDRLPKPTIWTPGSSVLVPADDGVQRISAYAVMRDTSYGEPRRQYVIEEMCADGLESALRILAALGRAAYREHVDTLTISEPDDGAIGAAAREIGCEVVRRTQPTGGGMGVILNRTRLLDALKDELRRRAAVHGASDGTGPAAAVRGSPADDSDDAASGAKSLDPAGPQASRAFDALRDGTLIENDAVLLRLLLGYWSLRDLDARAIPVPRNLREALAAWFPGSPTLALPVGYAHLLDRY